MTPVPCECVELTGEARADCPDCGGERGHRQVKYQDYFIEGVLLGLAFALWPVQVYRDARERAGRLRRALRRPPASW